MSMKENVLDKIISYLKNSPDCSCSTYCLRTDCNSPTITIGYENKNNCPNKQLESCMWFYKDSIEARVYYTELGQEWVKTHNENRAALLEVINFLNAYLWPASGIILSRLYVTKEYDIALTSFFDYRMFEGTETLETLKYFINYMPDTLDKISPFIFGVVLGLFNSEKAIDLIKEELLD